jgi:N-acetylmuramoyl-L-alanine amidase
VTHQIVRPGLVTGKGKAIRRVFIHCTATRAGQDVSAATIRKWHKDRGWSDIGYHFVIRLDGRIEKGRAEDRPGSHVAGFNTGSIGVVYVGGLDAQGKPADTRTPAQRDAMRALVAALVRAYPGSQVLGHRDASPDKDGDGVVEAQLEPFVRAWWKAQA